jgi:lipoprotein-anchoring transpeptidase ErfK/SrfK
MLRKYFFVVSIVAATSAFAACNEPQNASSGRNAGQDSTEVPQKRQPLKMPDRTNVTYIAVRGKDSSIKKYAGAELAALQFINRCDAAALKTKDTVLVPSEFLDVMQYSPFPFHVDALKDVKKIVFFSYPAQIFAAYEYGDLVHTGPTNMGRKKDPTPTGLFFANWKAEETKSTFNDEWELKWNFNIENKLGVGWHQYQMPGYPASHSCLRMLEEDAKYMYEWADQWELKGTDNVLANGTPVIVFGAYPFGSQKPWLALLQDPKAMDISEDALNNELQPHLPEIMEAQKKRAALGK